MSSTKIQPTGIVGFAPDVAGALAHLWWLVVREFRIRGAISALHQLDSRALADMGIERSEISRVVRNARREAERSRPFGRA
ncbi:MAG: DUF1127 domain-containing protein [Alphaproteobacteria bacterium]